ncbi:MFS transporter [Diaminobutyricimonas sp. TR449]|uniref:MFS transporter n=1 Tax=Diaminobutyricimonas sp. TR449 TaxID=2708076 RepID=UPI001AB02823|nr:MFS transporter [Diaminobutyricimonas sp. TR449]
MTERIYPGRMTRAHVTAWRNALFVVFALSGIGIASWLARVPAVRDVLGASTTEMGWLIFGLSAGSIVGLIAAGHVVATFGSRATMATGIIAGAAGLVIAGLFVTVTVNFWLTFMGLAIFGVGMAACDVAMNVSGAANERVLGRTVMPIYHAFFSIGTMLGAAAGGLAELLGVPIGVHIGAVAVVMAVGAIIAVRYAGSEHVLGHEDDTPPTTTWRERLGVWRDRRTLLIGLIVLGMAFAEGSANDWLALAMVDGHGVDNATGAFVFGIFVTAMTVGRLVGVRFLDRFGRVPVLRVSSVLAGIGLLLVILVPNPWVAGAGVVLWGLGSALGFPVGMSAAADDPRSAAATVSAVAIVGYCAFLVGPPVIGFLGEQVGLLNALLVVLVLIGVAGAVAPAAREPSRRPLDADADASN